MDFIPPRGTKQSSWVYRHRFLLFGGVAAFILGAIIFGKDHASVKADEARLVRVVTLQAHTSNTARFTGTVHARTESDLGFRVSGKIIQKLVDEGTTVKKGQVLMRIDPSDLKLAYNASVQAVEAVKAQNLRALKDEKRMKELLLAHAVSQQDYERAKSDADATSAQLKAAIAQQGVASNAADYAELKADADGVIMSVPADVGQVVAAGQPVLRLAQNGEREAAINLPEGALGQAKSATTAFLYTDPNSNIPVKLRELSAMADPLIRTYQARYTLKSNDTIPLGSTITVNFETKLNDGSSEYQVPLGALYDGGQGSSVWVLDDATSTVHTVPVTVVELHEETASVAGELHAGAHVVAIGAHLLKPDEKVRVAKNEGQAQ